AVRWAGRPRRGGPARPAPGRRRRPAARQAAMTVDLEESSLDLEFTNIAELVSGDGVGDIGWQGVAMQGGGFRADGLDGRFYGPDHEEAGGVFERGGIAGAFSLGRD
ncbi:MAG: hypothetical protein OXS40_05620, partial [Gammaproteobacteria bacterium]|nr:hypothetical protein [Gammaproteobacteria bacterium]